MNKTSIKSTVVAHSISPQGDEIISILATFPRIILAEVNTHRMLSKNTSSSRAIPFNKMVESIQNDPFIPIAWQKAHSGMQGNEYFDNKHDLSALEQNWLVARDRAIQTASWLHEGGLTKQLCNRLLEPFMWTTMLITGPRSGWENFFHLRNPVYEINCGPDDTDDTMLCTGKSWKELMSDKGGLAGDFDTDNVIERLLLNKGQAEIHMMALAECIYDAVKESTPETLSPGQWHIPFMNKIDSSKLKSIKGEDITQEMIKISVAMAARTSYTVVGEEKEVDYQKMVELHDRLLAQDPPHSSPLEHCARAMSDDEFYLFSKGMDGQSDHKHGWCTNLKGFISYRYLIDNKRKLC
jgi:thymidylate synthase ThyX